MIGATVALLIVIGLSTAAHAQEQCTALMQRAIELVSTMCSATGRNQACHGYFRVDAKDRSGEDAIVFNVGDIIPITDIRALTTAPMNLDEDEWGVALLRLQANLPDLLPGVNATFLLLGDSRIEEETLSPYAQPLQIFQLETGIAGVRCAESPADGLLVQTPEDMQEVKLTVNGVTIEAAGTAFVQAQPDKAMTVSALDGTVVVSLGDQRQELDIGTQVEIPMDGGLAPRGAMGDPVAFPITDVAGLPFELLPQPLESPVIVSAIANYTDLLPFALAPTLNVTPVVASTPTLEPTPEVAVTDAPETAAPAPIDPQGALLLFSVAVLVSLLIILLVVIAAMIVRSVLRQVRLKREAKQRAP